MRALLIVLTLALSGCGFTPMLAPTEQNGGVAIGPVAIPEIEGKSGFVFRTELERLLDAERGRGPLRSLEVKMGENISSVGLRADQSATRADLRLTARYRFLDQNGTVMFEGLVSSVASYDIPASAYGEIAAQDDARERAAQQLAERMRAELALRLAARNQK